MREKGLAASAKRDDRESAQGVVAVKITGNVAAIVKLKCETDFVAGSDQFIAEPSIGRFGDCQGRSCRERTQPAT